MSVLTEGKYTAEFLLSEANGSLSRENAIVIVAPGVTLPAGAVLVAGPEGYAPISEAPPGPLGLAILYAPVSNAGAAPAALPGVIIDAIAEVNAPDLDWNGVAEQSVLAAIVALRIQGVKVRNYVPLGS